MKKIIISYSVIWFTILVLSTKIWAQNISGSWTGTLKQKAGGTRTDYFFSMDLNVNGKNIEGTSYINYLDKPEIYALFKFSGTYENNQIRFFESSILSQREAQSMYWCTKYGVLLYTSKNNQEYLIGEWAAKEDGCSPGTLVLSRKKISAPQNSENEVITENEVKQEIEIPEKKIPPKQENIQKREVAKGTEVKIKGKTVTLKIFDHGKEDNDTISLYFNDKLLLDRYRLSKNPLKIVVEIDPKIKKNKLVFFAKNLGIFPPNTAAVIIEAEGFSKKVILRSDFNQSDVIYFESDK